MSGSLLEAFFFSFSADTSAVQEGIDAGNKGAENLNKSLMETDQVGAKVGRTFLDLAKSAGALLVGSLAFASIKAMAIESANATNELADNARALRTNANELAAWQRVAIQNGGTAEGFGNTLKMLSERYRDPQKGLEKLIETAERFKGLSDLKADRLGAQLGLDKGTVEAMRGGSEALRELIRHQKELSTVTQEDLDVAAKYKNQLNDTNTVYEDIRRKIATQVLPLLTAFLRTMEKLTIWMRENKWFVLGFFGAVAAIIAAVYLPAIISATVATLALLAPYILIGAAIAAVAALFALAYDDVMNFLAGNKSLIGEMAKKYPIIGDIVRGLAQAFKYVWDFAKLYLGFIFDLFTEGPTVAFANFKKGIFDIIDTMKTKFPEAAAVFEFIANTVITAISAIGTVWDAIYLGIKTGFEWLFAAFKAVFEIGQKIGGLIAKAFNIGAAVQEGKDGATGVDGKATTPGKDGKDGKANQPTEKGVKELVIAGQKQVSIAASSPVNAKTSNSITNANSNKTVSKQTNVTVPSVTINTQATSPDDIAKGFSKSLGEQLRSAQGQFDDGVES